MAESIKSERQANERNLESIGREKEAEIQKVADDL